METPIAEIASRVREEITRLEMELAEIAMLAQQAVTEAERHEGRRAQAEERLAGAEVDRLKPAELAELTTQLMTLTRRTSLMEAQVEILEGKKKAIGRHHDSLVQIAEALEAAAATIQLPSPGAAAAPSDETAAKAAVGSTTAAVPVPDELALVPNEVSEERATRLVLGVQEDLRREIARAMHDGPAQSLTNIVLEAQILERLLTQDPAAARAEMPRLNAMVQATLDATKRFIFDVRPMVLDDLGLVPTLRRAARDRGRPVGVPVVFESLGADRRLPPELESALFRMIDEALVSYLEARPDRVSIRLDWGDSLDVRVGAQVDESATGEFIGASEVASPHPALAQLIEERKAAATAAAQGAVRLPGAIWAEISDLAATIGGEAELLEDGAVLHVSVPLPDPA